MTLPLFELLAAAVAAVGAVLWITGELRRYGRRVPWWGEFGCVLFATGVGLLIGAGIGLAADRWLPW